MLMPLRRVMCYSLSDSCGVTPDDLRNMQTCKFVVCIWRLWVQSVVFAFLAGGVVLALQADSAVLPSTSMLWKCPGFDCSLRSRNVCPCCCRWCKTCGQKPSLWWLTDFRNRFHSKLRTPTCGLYNLNDALDEMVEGWRLWHVIASC